MYAGKHIGRNGMAYDVGLRIDVPRSRDAFEFDWIYKNSYIFNGNLLMEYGKIKQPEDKSINDFTQINRVRCSQLIVFSLHNPSVILVFMVKSRPMPVWHVMVDTIMDLLAICRF